MDLKQHILRQSAFSTATFGPGKRTNMCIDHIRSELDEIVESDGSPDEWVDAFLITLDGLIRSFMYMRGPNHRIDPDIVGDLVCGIITCKQTTNEGRNWPDWRRVDPEKAIYHIDNEDE